MTADEEQKANRTKQGESIEAWILLICVFCGLFKSLFFDSIAGAVLVLAALVYMGADEISKPRGR